MKAAILTVLILASLAAFTVPLLRVIRTVGRGKGSLSLTPLRPRVGRFISEVLLQSKVIRFRPVSGFFHALVFWGFMAFGLETLDHFALGYGVSVLGDGPFHGFFSGFVAIFAAATLAGILGLAFRRFVLRPPSLGKFSPTSLIVAAFIAVLMVTYLLDYAGTIEDGTTASALNWWIHSLTILMFLVLIPHSKHLHLALSPVTTFLKDLSIAGVHPLDFEKEEFGAEKLSDLAKHTVLGAFTCVECGRCRDHCPATTTGKVLDPKQFVLDLRKGYKADADAPIAGDFVNLEAVWQCTTCGACTTQCPVGIEHVTPILEIRRGQTAGGSFPPPLANLFKSLETTGNPWGYPSAEAEAFLERTKAPLFKGQRVLYWMGCMGRFDAQYQKVSASFMDLLRGLGVNFGVLPGEQCTGDAARRSGNEFLFAQLAETNIALLNEAKPSTIVSTCPHCVWALDEYKEMGLDSSVCIVHHAEFLRPYAESGKLSGKDGLGTLAYHDACYLSRYRGKEGLTSSRAVLARVKGEHREARRSKVQSFCCGAGGAQLFNEETQGIRINHARVDELIGTGADTIATSCPFCRLMLKDGLADRGREGMKVVDIAEAVSS